MCHSAEDAEMRNILTNVDTAAYLSQQLSILLFGKSEVRIPVKVYTDSLPLLESIASSRQVIQRLLRNTMNDLKQKLIDGDVQSYSWIDTKSMIADILTKEGGEIEAILEVKYLSKYGCVQGKWDDASKSIDQKKMIWLQNYHFLSNKNWWGISDLQAQMGWALIMNAVILSVSLKYISDQPTAFYGSRASSIYLIEDLRQFQNSWCFDSRNFILR